MEAAWKDDEFGTSTRTLSEMVHCSRVLRPGRALQGRSVLVAGASTDTAGTGYLQPLPEPCACEGGSILSTKRNASRQQRHEWLWRKGSHDLNIFNGCHCPSNVHSNLETCRCPSNGGKSVWLMYSQSYRAYNFLSGYLPSLVGALQTRSCRDFNVPSWQMVFPQACHT